MTHLVIAGTGRAGTSFLVRWLGACGLDTGFDDDSVNPLSRAGLERPLSDDPGLPYVVKDPWLHTYLERVDPKLVEVLVVPVRDLTDAAASRVRLERAAMPAGWDADTYGRIPGGLVYSLAVADQAAVLAVGFHRLIQWAVANDVALVLLDFERLVTDPPYALGALYPWLGNVDPDRAVEAHAYAAIGCAP